MPALSKQRHAELVTFLGTLGLEANTLDASALAAVEEALSHSSAGLPQNHERLEFLGDAVLRLAASEFLRNEQPQLSVGRHAALRAQLVSDRWLAELGRCCGIEQVWHLGAMAAGDTAGRATVLAEISEALIGALYLAWGGPDGGLAAVHQWLSPHWQNSLTLYLADPDRDNWKTALQEWSQSQRLGLPQYSCHEHSRQHGDPERFHCSVSLKGSSIAAEGRGPSRRAAEQAAAAAALQAIRPAPAV